MAYIGKSPQGSGVRTRYYYTATGGETSISGADDNGRTLTFTDGEYVDVYLNGILLVAGTDYGTGTTNTISSLVALNIGDIIEVVVYDIYSVAKINSEAIRYRYYKTASGGETSISGADDSGATITFPANAEIDVRVNGVSLVQGTDYNTTTANTVGGLTALTAGQVVEIVYFSSFLLSDTVSKAAGGTFGGDVGISGNITATNGTFSGNVSATAYYGDGSNLTNVGGGVVAQVTSAQVTATTHFSTTSQSYVTGSQFPSLTITPSSTSSKIMIIFRIGMQHDASGQIENTVYRNSTTDLSNGNTYGLSFSGGSTQGWFNNIITWVDSPNTTSAVRYTWYSRSENGSSVSPVHVGSTWSAVLMELT